jgi:ubiquitin carboxyl-terminal hydrolase 25/28
MVTADPSSLTELIAMGFTHAQAKEALEKCSNDKEQAINWIFSRVADPVMTDIHGPKEDDDLSKVIELSLQETSPGAVYSFDPISPEDRVRAEGVPVGLKNVGNTCYFNSLLQAYFMIPKFVQEVLAFKEVALEGTEDVQQGRVLSASLQLVKQLQRLFGYMTRSHRRYIDPSNVLSALVDDLGNQLMIGDQKDVGEFNIILVARIEDGMKPPKSEEEEAPEGEDSGRRDSSDVQLMRKGSLNYSISIPDEGVIAALFYGRQVELLTSAEADGTRVFQHQEAVFGQVMLDVDERDIYSAWDKACFSNIEGYVTPQDYKTVAQQEIWLTRLPQVLLFQIQRVCFDKASLSSVKKHTVFNIEKVIYPDRFMHHNRVIGSSLRQQAQELKAKVAKLEAILDKYQRFASDSLSLEKVLRNAGTFMAEQHDQTALNELERIESAFSYEQLKQAQLVLENYADQIRSKVSLVQSELASLKAEIKAAFDLEELKQYAYNLHSILVHDGMAGSGHYYAYIYNSELDKWRKYSDITVTDVTEQEVFERSIGGYAVTSAYCLKYVAATLDERVEGQVLRSFTVVADPEVTPDIYSTFLPLELRREVDDDNIRLKRELEDFRVNQVIKLMQDLYLSRHITAQSQCMSYRSLQPNSLEVSKFMLVNFVIYLKVKYEERLSRIHLLNLVVREVVHQDLEQLDKSGPLFQKIKTKLLKSHKDMPLGLDLNLYEVERFDKLMLEFHNNIRDASCNTLIYKALLKEDFPQALALINHETKRNSAETSVFHRPPKDLAKVGALFLMTGVNTALAVGNAEKAAAYASVIVAWVLELFSKFDIQYKQVQVSFNIACKALTEQGQSDLSQEFAFKSKALEANASAERYELPLPAEYAEVNAKVDSLDPQAWVEGWKSDSLASEYQELLTAVRLKYVQWYDLNQRIISLRRTLSEKELREFESKVASLHMN